MSLTKLFSGLFNPKGMREIMLKLPWRENVPHGINFTVMTMNLRFGLADDGDNSWENRKQLFPLLFDLYPFTFLGVQESNHFQTEFFNRILDTHKAIGWHNRHKLRWQSNLIFYHNTWQCLEYRHCFLSETPDMESMLPGSKWPGNVSSDYFRRMVSSSLS